MITSAIILSAALNNQGIASYYRTERQNHAQLIRQTASALQAAVSIANYQWRALKPSEKNQTDVIGQLDANANGWLIGIQNTPDCVALWQHALNNPPSIAATPLRSLEEQVPKEVQWASWHDSQTQRCVYKHFYDSQSEHYQLIYNYQLGQISTRTPW